jgi:hypothetical protein
LGICRCRVADWTGDADSTGDADWARDTAWACSRGRGGSSGVSEWSDVVAEWCHCDSGWALHGLYRARCVGWAENSKTSCSGGSVTDTANGKGSGIRAAGDIVGDGLSDYSGEGNGDLGAHVGDGAHIGDRAHVGDGAHVGDESDLVHGWNIVGCDKCGERNNEGGKELHFDGENTWDG